MDGGGRRRSKRKAAELLQPKPPGNSQATPVSAAGAPAARVKTALKHVKQERSQQPVAKRRLVAAPEPAGLWESLELPPAELRLSVTLHSGMSFRWRRRCFPGPPPPPPPAAASLHFDTKQEREWAAAGSPAWQAEQAKQEEGQQNQEEEEEEHVGVIDRWVVVLRQTATDVLWRTVPAPPSEADAVASRAAVHRYLQTDFKRAGLDAGWAKLDPTFAKRVTVLPGVRTPPETPCARAPTPVSAVNPGSIAPHAHATLCGPQVRLLAIPMLECLITFIGPKPSTPLRPVLGPRALLPPRCRATAESFRINIHLDCARISVGRECEQHHQAE